MRSFSGCSYYFTRSLKACVTEVDIHAIPFSNYSVMRSVLLRWGMNFATDPRPYFYMTNEYHQFNWHSTGRTIDRDDTYLSFSQIVPRTIRESDSKVLLMTDMTLSQYLKYEHFGDVPNRIAAELLHHERLSYERADRIFSATEVTADQLERIYHVPPSKIEVIGRGVNLPIDLTVDRPSREACDGRMRIAFVGHDYRRKGLPVLLDAIDMDGELQASVTVDVIGPKPEEFKPRDWLRVHGYIDKDGDLVRYIETLSGSDLGYLFSESEGIPGSVLEFMHLGVPCLISDIPEMASLRQVPGITVLPITSSAADLRDRLLDYVRDPSRLEDLRRQASQNAFKEWHVQAGKVSKWL